MFNSMPALASDIKIALPPWLINVSGMPVRGATASMDAIFIKACTAKYVAMPTAMKAPNWSVVRAAI